MPIVIRKNAGLPAADPLVDNTDIDADEPVISEAQEDALLKALARRLAWRDHVESMKGQEGFV